MKKVLMAVFLIVTIAIAYFFVDDVNLQSYQNDSNINSLNKQQATIEEIKTYISQNEDGEVVINGKWFILNYQSTPKDTKLIN